MKKSLLIAYTLFSLAANAQLKEGRIVYQRTVQMGQMRIFGNTQEPAPQMPKSRTDEFELLFSGNQSLWQFLPSNNNDDQSFSNGNGVFRMVNAGANEVIYHNFENGTTLSQRDVMDASFVVSDSIRKLNWKLTNDTKTILNYSVRKAISQRISTRRQMTMDNGEMKSNEVPDTANIIAWFTTDIPVPVGPSTYQGQLPGAILEMDVNNGQNIIVAVEVSPKVNVKKIKEPKDGKRVTVAEYNKERDRLMQEMQKNLPPGVRMNVRTN